MHSGKKDWSSTQVAIILSIVGCLVLLSPFAYLALSQVPFFYYRHFNRVQARLAKLPDTKIVDSWQHEDVTLEDFGFDLQVRQCPPIRLNFYEGGEWYRVFGRIDGIMFCRPYNPATNGYDTTPVSREELAAAGIQVRSLAEAVAHMEALLAYVKSSPQPPAPPRRGGYYIRILYDLNAYNQNSVGR